MKPILLLGYGNPARGDDGLGPAFLELMGEGPIATPFDSITDYQLQIEHALDLQHRQRVIFIDASVSATAPFEFTRVLASRDDSYTSHALSPAAVLAVYEQINSQTLPRVELLSIRGYQFDLGEPVSLRARENLQQAVGFLRKILGMQEQFPAHQN